MIIGISGKKQTGKDTVAKIIQYLDYQKHENAPYDTFEAFCITGAYNNPKYKPHNNWQTKQFAGKLKQIVALITGCDVEDLENEEFKNSKLSKEWIRYGYANGFIVKGSDRIMVNETCSKEKYEEERGINWQTAYIGEYTYRSALQFIGTDLFRNQFHSDVWINALFADYKEEYKNNPFYNDKGIYDVTEHDEIQNPAMLPNWIITDVRFPNDAKAIKDRGGIIIRKEIEKYYCWKDNNGYFKTNTPFVEETKGLISISKAEFHHEMGDYYKVYHESETALDNYNFDYVLEYSENIEDLIENVKQILIKEKII